jgi:AcrR family transcriptional regulator
MRLCGNREHGGSMVAHNDSRRYEAIVTAAWSCFLKYGYAETTLVDIAGCAGVSRPLIYLKFSSKKDLFCQIVNGRMDCAFEDAKRVLSLDLDIRAKLFGVIEKWFLDPLTQLFESPRGSELIDQALGITPTLALIYQERTRELLMAIIGDAMAAEVLLKGLTSDRPSIKTLRARIALLVEHFVA